MLIQLEDVVRTTTLTKQRYIGIVVDNVDPENLGRIKVKVPNMIEALQKDRLPWVYPFRGAETGGNPASATHAVPEKFSQVYVTFPNGDPYSAYYEAAPLNRATTQDPSHANPVPEAPLNELRNQVDPAESDQSNIVTHGWRTERGHSNWFRIDRNQGKVELYMGEADLFFHFDRGGNVQLKTPGNLDFDIGGKITFKSGKDFTMQVGEQYSVDVGKDATFKTAKKWMIDVGSDASMKVSGNRGAIISGDDDVSVSGNRTASIRRTDGLKARRVYQDIRKTVTIAVATDPTNIVDTEIDPFEIPQLAYNLQVNGITSIWSSTLMQLDSMRILENTGGAMPATTLAVTQMRLFFLAIAALKAATAASSSSSGASQPVNQTPMGSLFPAGTNLAKPLSQQTPAIQAQITSLFQSYVFNNSSTANFFSAPLSTVFGSQPLSQFSSVANISELFGTLSNSTITQYLSPEITNGLNPSQIFSGDIKSLLTSMAPEQLLGVNSLSTLFGSVDPIQLINSISSVLLNGFSLDGLDFEFIGRKIISEFLDKFARHLTALARLAGRVQLMATKLNVLDTQGSNLQTRAREFTENMEKRADQLVGEADL